MTRIALIALFVMAFAAALPARIDSQTGARRNRPNIVFILADDPYEKKESGPEQSR